MLIAKTKNILSNFLIEDYLMILLAFFFVIYAFFSSNVPRSLGPQHYLMILIAVLALILYLIEIKKTGINKFFNNNLLYIFILATIVYGTVLGIFLKNLDKNILRDLFGVSSILSIFLLGYFRNKKINYLRFFFKILVFTGFIFSIKTSIFYNFFLDYSNYPDGNPIQVAKYHFLYLENTIILSLVFFLMKIYENIKKNKFFKIIKYSLLLYFPLSVVSDYALRGPIIFIFFSLILFLCIRSKSLNGLIFSFMFLLSAFFVNFIIFLFPLFFFIYYRKKKIIYIFISLFFVLFLFDHIFLWSAELSQLTHRNILFDHKIKKFAVDIFNHRQEEYAIFKEVFMNLNFYFGKGFGALFLNPINNSHVLFFHNFSLYYFYKLGVVGILFIILIFILIIFNVYKFFYNYFKLENIDKNIYISLFSSLLYPMILSATYKSISFGFILGLFLTLKYKHDDRKNI